MGTTRTTTHPEGAGRLRVLVATLLALALGLSSYAVLWLTREGGLIGLHAVARDIRYGRLVPVTEIARLMPRIIAKDTRRDLSADDLDDAALIASLFAEQQRSNRIAAPALWAVAEQLIRERLARAPADGNSWLRLSYVRTQRFGLDVVARQALRMSWLVTPREFSVMWPSLKFRIEHWADLTADEKGAAADLMVGLWHKPPARADVIAYWARLSVNQRSELLSLMRDPLCKKALTTAVR